MDHEQIVVKVDGAEIPELYADLARAEVELDEDLAAMVRLRVAMPKEPDGSWRHLDDARLSAWKRIEVAAGFADGPVPLVTGYLTHVRPHFDPDPARCALELWAMDESVRLDRAEALKAWPDKKDSDIAREIFNVHGLRPVVDDTDVVHDEAVSTIVQRETDMQFLKRLAARNGFECFVEDGTGYFRQPPVTTAPRPVLAVHFGDETSIGRFSLEVNALSPVNVTMYQDDRAENEGLEAAVSSATQGALGRTRAAAAGAPGVDDGQVFVAMVAATGVQEMRALCQGLYHQAEWFVTGEGEIAGSVYGHVLKPRDVVPIKGVGETHSGLYYVTHVTHEFTPTGYVQCFRVKRNALLPTGDEPFAAGAGGLLGGLL